MHKDMSKVLFLRKREDKSVGISLSYVVQYVMWYNMSYSTKQTNNKQFLLFEPRSSLQCKTKYCGHTDYIKTVIEM